MFKLQSSLTTRGHEGVGERPIRSGWAVPTVCYSLWARFSNESHNTRPLSIQISTIHKAPFAQALLRSQRWQASEHNGAQQEAEKRGPFCFASVLQSQCSLSAFCVWNPLPQTTTKKKLNRHFATPATPVTPQILLPSLLFLFLGSHWIKLVTFLINCAGKSTIRY